MAVAEWTTSAPATFMVIDAEDVRRDREQRQGREEQVHADPGQGPMVTDRLPDGFDGGQGCGVRPVFVHVGDGGAGDTGHGGRGPFGRGTSLDEWPVSEASPASVGCPACE